jgi:hypothetical protein
MGIMMDGLGLKNFRKLSTELSSEALYPMYPPYRPWPKAVAKFQQKHYLHHHSSPKKLHD